MPLELMIALILILPVIIFVVIFVWYLNLGRAYATVKETPRKNPVLPAGEKPETGKTSRFG